MKMKLLKPIYALLAISTALFFNSCQKELSGVSGSSFTETPAAKIITATVQGQVSDENGAIVANASVEVNGSLTTTNKYGVFRFENVSLNQNGGVIKVSKAGYFNGFRSMFYDATNTNFVRIQLMPKQLVGTIDAATGGVVTVSGASVSLPANGVVKAAGSTAFTGTIQVYAAYMDPTKLSTLSQMPGNLFGTQTDNTLAGLESYGMLAVELESAAGEKLQVATGSEATLSFPVSATAPATVPLWYFDESTGFWKEEGTATKTGSAYVAKVKHFSFWNCDAPFPTVTFKAKFIDQNGNPLIHKQVVITRAATGYYTAGYGYTDSLGKTNGLIPKNESLVLTIKGECGQTIFTQTISASTTNVDLGTVTVNTATATMVEVKGKLLSCSNASVSNGYVSLIIGNFFYRVRPDTAGNFVIRLLNCSNATTGTIIGYDYANLQEGAPVTVAITSGTVNVGNVVACGTVIQTSFFNYTINGTPYALTAPPDSLSAYYFPQTNTANRNTTISGFKLSGTSQTYASLYFGGNETLGTKAIGSFSANGKSYGIPAGAQVTITAFGSVGQFIEGSFTGNFTDSLVSVPVTLSFKVRRN